MTNVVSIATASYHGQIARLARSIHRSDPGSTLTVFVDDEAAFADLKGLAELVPHPAIQRVGAKRAKFEIQRRAVEEIGHVVYLDADVVVLESLTELASISTLAAAPDDLSAAPYVADRRHPWPNDPGLENRRYINSGVLVLPASALDFLRHVEHLVRDDDFWDRYILPGFLYDNHVLCAVLNLEDVPMTALDPRVWNWPGYRDALGQLQVERRGDHLVSRSTHECLRLVHFAGIRDIDAHLARGPLAISSLIQSRSAPQVVPLGSSVGALQATLSDGLGGPANTDDAVALEVLYREMNVVAERVIGRQQPLGPLLDDPASCMSVALSLAGGHTRWNDLLCGGAYLEGEEYNFLRDLVRRWGVALAVETGAGETSRLLREARVKVISLETNEGPWVERARAGGAACAVIPFDPRTGFHVAALSDALGLLNEASPDLLFIDAPPGTAARRVVLDQLLSHTRPRLVLMHDAHRDAAVVFAAAARWGFTPIEYLASHRGMVLLAAPTERATLLYVDPREMVEGRPIADPSIRLNLQGDARFVAGNPTSSLVDVHNDGLIALTSRSSLPVHLSYHWFDDSGCCAVFDGERTRLPFTLHAGDRATVEMVIVAPAVPGPYSLCLTAVQESVAWFDGVDSRNACIVRTVVHPHDERGDRGPAAADIP